MDQLLGIGVEGYRSFNHGAAQYLAPMAKVNLVAGQNNAGKSNLLRVIAGSLPGAPRESQSHPLDVPVGTGADGGPTCVSIAVPTAAFAEALRARVGSGFDTSYVAAMAVRLQELLGLPGLEEFLWYRYVFKNPGLELDTEWILELDRAQTSSHRDDFRNLSSAILNSSGGPSHADLERVLKTMDPVGALPRAATISAYRRIEAGDQEASLDGSGLIHRLADLERPEAVGHDEERAKFDAIQEFTRSVLDDPGLTLTVPTTRTTINVRLSEGGVLPLEHMGTGIHQVVILAAAATLLTDTVVCMEEPEIHLHPLLQRKLLNYLAHETTNQYVIATHSAHMLDADVASIFHLTHESRSGTRLTRAATPAQRAGICADLGYRASDLVQANAVVWVEGPSDRIYIRRWIELLDPSLIEGIHYSIMFYGGRLLNHLTADDPDVDEFISLRRLNRQVAILIDSDRSRRGARLNATKKRVVDELSTEGFAWVTHGYTIENYVPFQDFQAAVTARHGGAHLETVDRWGNPLAAPALTGVKQPDKLGIARGVAERWKPDTTWPYDLRDKVRGLVDFIRAAN
ncbi:AAA family ATPase [Cellulosimicrobium sp. Marseille-Q4280]|uniref:AAA family ATPase n=1 Tax=Cellulosimicrobium sp. Marseille-Q4280 TaxID=2937992 RepID=UPI00204083B7|nr:AAA family ATPase [Cellulosimicrobium sp. Marseille-Q4280]